MEKSRPLFIFGLMALGVIVFILGVILFFEFFPEKMTFNFYINETGERLEGKVYFEDFHSKQQIFLGETRNGKLKYNLENLYPGNILFKGEYEEISFEYEYFLDKESLDHKNGEYILTEDEIRHLKFKLSEKDLNQIKTEMFDLINHEREKKGIENLKRKSFLDEVAQDYAERMLKEDFYAHNDPQGKNHYDRLQEREIYYVAATENLNMIYAYSDTNISEENVYGWIKSPGHSVAMLDTNKPLVWNNLGIGLACEKIGNNTYHTCYSVALFVGLNTELINEELKKDYIQLLTLYPEEYEYEYETKVKVIFNSTSPARIILTDDKKDFDRLVNRNNLQGEIFKKDTNYYEEELILKKGHCFLIHSRTRNILYNFSIEYNI